MTKQTQTSARTPKPIPALLEGSFGTAIENRIAELNNQLARENRLTSDPLAVTLRALRSSLKEHGFTFERVGVTPVVTAPAAAPAAPKAAKAVKTTKEGPVAPPKAAAPATSHKPRVIKPEQIEEFQVAGSVSDTAPYGLDEKGRALAPYGIKNDGVTPMKRRGRVAAAVSEEPAATMPEPRRATKAAPAAVAAPVETEIETVTEEAPMAEESEDDLDELLSGL